MRKKTKILAGKPTFSTYSLLPVNQLWRRLKQLLEFLANVLFWKQQIKKKWNKRTETESDFIIRPLLVESSVIVQCVRL